ncbi:MAG: hypothetical protein CMH57_04550 [Myxococcales bacterium]|nr:hypothetical protein [Myxococcales bacterium]
MTLTRRGVSLLLLLLWVGWGGLGGCGGDASGDGGPVDTGEVASNGGGDVATSGDDASGDTGEALEDAEAPDSGAADTAVSNTEPSDTEPSDTEPSDTEPSDTAPSDTEPSPDTEDDTSGVADVPPDAPQDVEPQDTSPDVEPDVEPDAPTACPAPPATPRTWEGWDYEADFDGDGALTRHAWDAEFHDVWVPDATDAVVVTWEEDPSTNRRNIVAAIRSGATKIRIAAPPEAGQGWRVDNQIPIIKDFDVNAADGLQLLFDEGVIFEAADAPYFHDDTSKLISVDEMVGLRMGAWDTDGDGVVAPTTIRMRRDLYDPTSPSHDPAYPPSESRHGLRLFRSRDVLIQDLTFADTGGDGIYLGDAWVNYPEEDPPIHVMNQRVTLRRVVADNNYRQGMTVTGVWGLRVEDSEFSRTRGTSPQWGIDFEPNNAWSPTRDVVIRGSRFMDNARAGVGLAMGHFRSDEPIEVAIVDSVISGAAGGSDGVRIHNFDDGRVANIYLGGVVIEDVDYFGVFFSGKNAETAPVTLESTVLRRTARQTSWPTRNDDGDVVEVPTAPLTFSKAYVDRYVGGVTFLDALVCDDQPRPALRVLPRGDGLKGIKALSGRLLVHNPHGAAIDLDDTSQEPPVDITLEVVPTP